jgi:phage terminase large subunit-like protein
VTRALYPSPQALYSKLVWLDGSPMVSVMDDYLRKIHEDVLYTFDDTGRRVYDFAVLSRAKKNAKSLSLVLAALYELLIPPDPRGNDVYIIGVDHDAAREDLQFAAKIVAANPLFADEVEVLANQIRRRDGRGSIITVASRDAFGLHGRTARMIAYDEAWWMLDYAIPDACSRTRRGTA